MTNEPGEFLGRLIQILEAVDVPYLIVGGLAAIAHGRPRTTQDVDVLVVLDGRGARRLVAAFPRDDWYADEDAALEAVRSQRQFNVIHTTSGWKADLIVRSRHPFHLAEFDRRRRMTLSGVAVWIATPEDTLLAKLDWSTRCGGSERQRDDVRGILAVQGDGLDRDYLEHWIEALGLRAEWDRVQVTA